MAAVNIEEPNVSQYTPPIRPNALSRPARRTRLKCRKAPESPKGDAAADARAARQRANGQRNRPCLASFLCNGASDLVSQFDYTGEVGLYAGKAIGGGSGPRDRRFQTAAEALRFAVEDMPHTQQRGSLLETRGVSTNQICTLYDAPEYPLSHSG